MKIFEPDGGTGTPEALQWLSIAIIVLSVILLGNDILTGVGLVVVIHLGLLISGVVFLLSARRRKRK